MTQMRPITGRSTTMFRKSLISTLAAAAAILAFSASAAQANPIGLGYNGHTQFQSSNQGYQGTYRPTQVGAQIMNPAVDPANAQQVPVVVTQAQPAAASDSGFNWTAALLGAGIASVVLLLAGATASRVRPRRVAQL
jgi:hypothetical protein